jgi:hypothetical protein
MKNAGLCIRREGTVDITYKLPLALYENCSKPIRAKRKATSLCPCKGPGIEMWVGDIFSTRPRYGSFHQ